MHRAFISYTERSPDNRDGQIYDAIRQSLLTQGFNIWCYYDPAQAIRLGHNIRDACNEEIDRCQLFIPLISRAFLESEFCRGEMLRAQQRAERGNLPILAALFDNLLPAQIPESFSWLREYLTLNGSGKSPAAIADQITEEACRLFSKTRIEAHPVPNMPLIARMREEVQRLSGDAPRHRTGALEPALPAARELLQCYQNRDLQQALQLAIGVIVALEIGGGGLIPRGMLYYPRIVQAVIQLDLADATDQADRRGTLLKDAETAFRNLTNRMDEIAASDTNAWAGLGIVHLKRHEFAQALKCFETARARSADFDPALIYLLVLSATRVDREQRTALQALNLPQLFWDFDAGWIVQDRNDATRLALVRAIAFIYQGDVETGLAALERIPADALVTNEDLLLFVGQELRDHAIRKNDDRRFVEAIQVIDPVKFSADPIQREYAFHFEARLLLELNSIDQASRVLEILSAQYPNFAPYLMELGLCRELLEDRDAARRLYRQAEEAPPPRSSGELLFHQQRLDDHNYARGHAKWRSHGPNRDSEILFRDSHYDTYDWYPQVAARLGLDA